MSLNPTFDSLSASVSLLDDSNTTTISYTAPFTTTSNNTCYGGTCTSFQDANGALQFQFTGTNVWVFGKTGGLVRVFVDDQFVRTIDASLADYSSFPNDSLKQPALWASGNLDGGDHTLKLAGVPGKDLNLLIDFFAINGTALTSSDGYNPTPAETRRLTGIIVGTLFAFFAGVALLGFLCFFVSRLRKKRLVNHNNQPEEKGRNSSSGSPKEPTVRGDSGRWSFFHLGLSKFLERKRNTFPLITLVRQREQPSSYYETTQPYSISASPFATDKNAQEVPYPARQPYSIDQALLQPEAMSPPATSTTTTVDEDPFRTRRYVVSDTQASASSPDPNGAFVGGFSTRPRPKAPYEPPASASSGSVYSMPAFGEPTVASRVQKNHQYPPLNVQQDAANIERRGSEEVDEATPLVEKPPTYPYPRSTEGATNNVSEGKTLATVPSTEKSASSTGNSSGRRRAVDEEEGGYATYGVSSSSGHHGSVRGPRPHRTSTLVVNEETRERVPIAVPPRAQQEGGRQVEAPRRPEGRQRGRGASDPESPLDPAVVFMWR